MSNYGDMYRDQAEQFLLDQWCPDWATNESRRVRLALAKGRKAESELEQMRAALHALKKAIER